MPGIGGRFGWNEPPPAAITTIFASNTSLLVGDAAEQADRRSASMLAITMRLKVELRLERRDLLHQLVDQALRR